MVKMAKIWWNAKSIIKRIFSNFGYFSQYKILKCAVDSEWNGVINLVVSCSVVKLFICRNDKDPGFNGPTLHKTTLLQLDEYKMCLCCGALSINVLDFSRILREVESVDMPLMQSLGTRLLNTVLEPMIARGTHCTVARFHTRSCTCYIEKAGGMAKHCNPILPYSWFLLLFLNRYSHSL